MPLAPSSRSKIASSDFEHARNQPEESSRDRRNGSIRTLTPARVPSCLRPPQHQVAVEYDEFSSLLNDADHYCTAGTFGQSSPVQERDFSVLRCISRPLNDLVCGIASNSSSFIDNTFWQPVTSFLSRTFTAVENSISMNLREDYHERHVTDSIIRNRRLSMWRKLSIALRNETAQSDDMRLWYDQFTSVDWIHDAAADSFRVKELRRRPGCRGQILVWIEAAQGCVFATIIGFLTAWIAFIITVSERALFDLKFGHCSRGWLVNKSACCSGLDQNSCTDWISWSETFGVKHDNHGHFDFIAYLIHMLSLAFLSCVLTIQTGITISRSTDTASSLPKESVRVHSSKTLYSAAGSGVAEVRVILSGFILHGFLDAKTLIIKSLGLILSVASGLSVGKEGPLVHIATCIGNLASRLSSKYRYNQGKLRELLSGAAGSGVAVAFGAPISGVLFSLEEVSYYFPAQTLFQTFLCCITAALSLKFLDPYGTGKIVIFQVDYDHEWNYVGLVIFMFLGILGGTIGALFIKASKLWAQSFRRIAVIQDFAILEVMAVALISGILSFWNRYTNLPVAELLLELTSPCNSPQEYGTGLCPTIEQIPGVIGYLLVAFVVKSFLTTITFGLKVPAGIYIPSMVVGGLLGRIVGHAVQYFALQHPQSFLFSACAGNANVEACAVPGVYALLTAGATMCGVTRLTVTLAVILFELTGSLNYVLPFSVAIFTAKLTADAIEPLNIYDVVTQMNHYPFLDNKFRPDLSAELQHITSAVCEGKIVDVSQSVFVPVNNLRRKLSFLHALGEFDGGLPIIKNGVLIGLISCPDLEFALDLINQDESELCIIGLQDDINSNCEAINASDLRPFIDPAPVALDAHSPLELVYDCFAKLGLRYICVLKRGQFIGILHKKAFVKHVNEIEVT